VLSALRIRSPRTGGRWRALAWLVAVFVTLQGVEAAAHPLVHLATKSVGAQAGDSTPAPADVGCLLCGALSQAGESLIPHPPGLGAVAAFPPVGLPASGGIAARHFGTHRSRAPPR